MQQNIYLIGLNHKTAPIEVREKFSLTEPQIHELGLTNGQGPVRELLLLSTCNRVELLVVGDSENDLSDHVLKSWANLCGKNFSELKPYTYIYSNSKAINHVFKVASSLDSMVLGEPQILGQLKEAYRNAVQQGTSQVIINRLLHKAFSVAKRVRSETRIAQNAVSISYAAVELAKEIFADLKKQTALLMGAGEMAELAATHLLNSGVKHLLVTNRTYSRANKLAQKFHAMPIPFSEFYNYLSEVDIVISSTGSNDTIIQAKDMNKIIRKRKNKPMFFIDIAVPRDIDPDLNNLDNIYLYDIDDLKGVVEENLNQRQEEAKIASSIIQEEVTKFEDWMRSLKLTPTIVDLLQQGEEIALKEVQKAQKNLSSETSPEVFQAMETLAKSLTKKLYHNPITFLKRKAQEENNTQDFISLTRRMFDLDYEPISKDAHNDKKKKRGKED